MGLNDSSDWDATAHEYTAIPIAGPLYIPCKRMLEAMDTASAFATASAILDVGCGPGTAETLLIDAYGKDLPSTARLIASDFSKGMVEETNARREKILAEGNDVADCWKRLETSVMDAENLSTIPSDSLSHVMGSLVYFMLPDPRKGLMEAKRVLKEGGVFACTSWARVDWMRFLREAAQKVRPNVSRRFVSLQFMDGKNAGSRERTDGEGQDPAMLGPWKDTEGVKVELQAAGFRDVQVEYVDVDLPIEDRTGLSNILTRSNNPATKMVVGDFNDEEVARCREELVKILEQNGNICKGVAVMGIGKK